MVPSASDSTLFTLAIWTLVVVTVLTSIVTREHPLRVRLAAAFVSFTLLSTAVIADVGSMLHPVFARGGAAVTSQQLIVAVWWLLAARLALLVGRAALGINHQQHAKRLASDLVAGAIYLGAGLAVLNLAFGVSVTGLVATSGVIAIVLGLALQNTLSDLFSGIAIGIEQPFGIGDVIWIEGQIEGVVLETNWRSTLLVTDTNDIATVPNSVVAKSRLLNRSRPSEIRIEKLKVWLDPNIPPERGIALLTAALLNTDGVARDPQPKVICRELRGEGIAYEIWMSAPIGKFADTRSDLLHNVNRHTRYAGAAMAMQNSLPLIPLRKPDVAQILNGMDLFASLSEAERATLESQATVRHGQAGDIILEQGGCRAFLFIVTTGVFAVTHDFGEGTHRIGTAGPGDHVGTLSILAGLGHAATVTALTDFSAIEITKAMLTPLMAGDSALLHAMERSALKARTILDRAAAMSVDSPATQSTNLIERLRSFFELPHAGHGLKHSAEADRQKAG